MTCIQCINCILYRSLTRAVNVPIAPPPLRRPVFCYDPLPPDVFIADAEITIKPPVHLNQHRSVPLTPPPPVLYPQFPREVAGHFRGYPGDIRLHLLPPTSRGLQTACDASFPCLGGLGHLPAGLPHQTAKHLPRLQQTGQRG